MTDLLEPRAIGMPLERLDGPGKVVGTAPYAFEHPVPAPLHLHPVQATVARGRIVAIDTEAAAALEGVVAVMTHENAPRLASDEDRELWVLQDDEIHFRGQFVGAVVAETPEVARQAADLVRVEYAVQPHDVALSADRGDLYAPGQVNAGFPVDTDEGDVDGALASAAVTIDRTYTTPMEHNNPMEPHTTVALWADGGLTLYDSTQGVYSVRKTLAPVFGLDPGRIRVIAPHVGGGFGSKGMPHAHDVLAGLAARMVAGRPVKFALTRQQMFCMVGYRTPTIQRIRLGADHQGRLTALVHDVVEQTSRLKEFAEQTAVVSRMMYATPNRRTTHRLAALDVPVPSWMRAPGETPGMFAAEVAMDELAIACGLDPIELRILNEPEADPESGKPWSCRNLRECLREGARRFAWDGRDPAPAVRRRGGWLVGTGVASSTYPRYAMPGSKATIHYGEDQRYVVRIGAADIGTGTWTALTQIAADALGCPVEAVRLEIGDTDLPMATVAGGSSGITSWGSAIVAAARAFREEHGAAPAGGTETTAEMPENPGDGKFAVHSFGAQFAEVHVNADTGEIRVARMLGVFSVGRVINPRTARSQFIGGMTMGLSMALHEQSVVDPRFGHVVNHDFAEYHIAANADVMDMDAVWLAEADPHSNPMGSRGIGEIGIVGAAAAIANAAYHATGVRVRDLPITADKLIRAETT
ncbi:MAG TPA: xanthine dehydrogenase family protein molybdopterin-binding subunit [Alphaproteobacteria bacterium]|nr:xanthine dehydrogenase family protein molybdopterin-binding subunit [Alphaproteobacteria bacterium]